MFGIFKVIFDEYIFIFGTIAIAVASFLLAEFAVKRLNTKLIVSAVSMIIYLISSFILASDGAISYLVFIIFLFAGMISISVFIGVAIDTIFRLIKKKTLFVIISIVLVLVIGFVVWWNVPQKLCDIDAQKVEKITIFKTWFQEEIEVTDEQTITELVEKFNTVKMKHCRYAPNTFGYVYIVTIQTESETQKFTIDVMGVSKTLNYIVIEGDTGFDYIDDMF